MALSSSVGSHLDKALAVAQPQDIYYYNSKTLRKQKIPTIQSTKFVQSLASLEGGSSVIVVSPEAGLQHVVLGLKLKAPTDATGLALPKAWGYSAIDNIQFRYGSSTTYQKSGAQLLIEAIATAGSPAESNALMSLAGNELNSADDFNFTGVNENLRYAYCVLPLPHCGAQSGSDLPNPMPTELLSSPIVITITLKRQADIFKQIPGTTGEPPMAFEEAYLQTRSITPVDRGQLMKLKGDELYSMPVEFYQQVNSVALQNQSDSQEVVLTGIRSGTLKGIHVWLKNEADTVNPFQFVPIVDAELMYMGNVIHKYKGVSSQLFDTIFTDTPSYFNNSTLSITPGPVSVWNSTDAISSWCHFPFAQRYEQMSAENTTLMGLGVANGTLNLRMKVPVVSGANWRLYYSPVYSSALVMGADGSCEVVF